MKINSEEILLQPNYKTGRGPYFISGNEETMMKKIEEILINKYKREGFAEQERVEKIDDLNNGGELFYKTKVIILSNLTNLNKHTIENTIKNGDILIVISKNSSKDKTIKKLFTIQKNYRLVLCYSLDRQLKTKILNQYLKQNNISLQEDVFWYLVEHLDNKYVFFTNDIEKICLQKNKSPSLQEVKKIINKKTDLEFEKMFFKIFYKNNEIIKLYYSSMNNLSDFYSFFYSFKFFFNLIINNTTEQEVVKSFPRYLFKDKETFLTIYKKINNNKKKKLSELIYKTEYLVRKNNNQFEAIGLRFLLNFKKIVNAF